MIKAEGVEFSSGLVFMMPGEELRMEMDPTMWIKPSAFVDQYEVPEGHCICWSEELLSG